MRRDIMCWMSCYYFFLCSHLQTHQPININCNSVHYIRWQHREKNSINLMNWGSLIVDSYANIINNESGRVRKPASYSTNICLHWNTILSHNISRFNALNEAQPLILLIIQKHHRLFRQCDKIQSINYRFKAINLNCVACEMPVQYANFTNKLVIYWKSILI